MLDSQTESEQYCTSPPTGPPGHGSLAYRQIGVSKRSLRKMPYSGNPPPPKTLTELIDRLDVIREELTRIQRALEKMEIVPPDGDHPSED